LLASVVGTKVGSGINLTIKPKNKTPAKNYKKEGCNLLFERQGNSMRWILEFQAKSDSPKGWPSRSL
jgi:hypothetical protein